MKKAATLNKVWSLVLRQGTQTREGLGFKWNSWHMAGALITIIGLVTNSCSDSPEIQHLEGSTMGTFYTVAYRGDIVPENLKPRLEKHLADIEAQLSNWDEESWISRFNYSSNTHFVHVPPHAHRVVKHALELATQTNRALDPTLGSLINLWGFGPTKADRPPDAQKIRNALKSTGPERLILRVAPARIAKTHPDLQLNVSSIAKGYASDVLARVLDKEGITDYVVNIGGEMRINGRPEKESFWKIAIQKPAIGTPDGQAHLMIQLNKAALATSGDYRHFLEIDGQHYPHILNPDTGWPATTDLASATIIAPTSMQADGFATACMVLGLQRAQELISGIPGVEGLFIQRMGKNKFHTYTTSGWPNTELHNQPQEYDKIYSKSNAQVQ